MAKKKIVSEVDGNELLETTQEEAENPEAAEETTANEQEDGSESEEQEDNTETEDAGEDEDETEEEGSTISDEIDKAILQIRKNTSRSSARTEKMSKAKKKELYHSEHVITEFGDETLVTESMEKKKEYTELVASQKSKKILKGIITGFHYANDEDPASTILAEVLYGNGYFNVIIPSYLLFDYELDEKYTDKENNKLVAQQVERRLNSTVEFVVHTFDKNGVAYADRLMALSMKGVSNYVGKGLNPARITPGLLVESKVVMVGRTFVIVDALGAEIKIPQDELAYHHVGDAREEFHVGESVNVRIKTATTYKVKKYDNSYTLIDATASIKAAKPDRRKEFFDQFRVGGRYAATVTYVDDNIYVNLSNKMDAMVAFPKFGAIPVRGDQRVVEVTGKDPEKLFIYGVFVNN